MKLNQNNTGLEAEKLAATFLLNQGLTLLAQNYHCRYGEIDLIMQETKTLVFIEVRLRKNSLFGGAGSSITPQKMQKLILTSQHYLQTHNLNQSSQPCRFDAILMDVVDTKSIEWVRNAFDA